jgi:uncharacterized low-complexity protein
MKSKSLLLSLSAAATLGLNAQAFANNNQPLQTEKLDKGYNASQPMKVADGKCSEGKCGEGKCGNDTQKSGEGKCGEGKCGEGKCGSGTDGN